MLSKIGIRTVDVGNAMLSMHSIRETAGSHDVQSAIDLFVSFFEGFSELDKELTVDWYPDHGDWWWMTWFLPSRVQGRVSCETYTMCNVKWNYIFFFFGIDWVTRTFSSAQQSEIRLFDWIQEKKKTNGSWCARGNCQLKNRLVQTPHSLDFILLGALFVDKVTVDSVFSQKHTSHPIGITVILLY